MPTPGMMTFSQLSAYTQCPRKYRYSYVDGQKGGPFAPLIFGSLMHEVIEDGENEELWKHGPDVCGNSVPLKTLGAALVHPRDGVMTRLFRERMVMAIEEVGGIDKIRWAGKKTKEYPNGEDGMWWYWNAGLMIRRWAHLRQQDEQLGLRFEERGVERQLSLQLPDGRPLRITMDALMYRQTSGRLLVRDYKTGVRNQADPRQLIIYGYGVSRLMDEVPEVEFAYLRGGTRDDQLKRFNVDGLVAETEEWYAWLAAALNSGLYPAFPSSWCKSCQHLDVCPVGRQYVGTDGSQRRAPLKVAREVGA